MSSATYPAIAATFTPVEPPSSDLVSLHLGELVPQVPYQSKNSPLDEMNQAALILFVMRNMNGFPIKAALDEKYTGLVGRDDQIFSPHGPSSTTLRIEWPGYGSWNHQVDYFSLLSRTNLDSFCVLQIRTMDWRKPPRPATLAKLATGIAKSVKRFIDVRPRKLCFFTDCDLTVSYPGNACRSFSTGRPPLAGGTSWIRLHQHR